MGAEGREETDEECDDADFIGQTGDDLKNYRRGLTCFRNLIYGE